MKRGRSPFPSPFPETLGAGPKRLVLLTCAVAAFAATWVRLQHEAPAPVGDRPGTPAVVELASDWPGPEPTMAPVRVPAGKVDDLLVAFDSDLGDEGTPVDRQAIEQALNTDSELRRALGLP